MITEELKRWQDEVMETAKSILQKENRVYSVMHILTKEENIPENHPFLRAEGERKNNGGDVIAIIPLIFGPRELLTFVEGINPKLAYFVQNCRAVGQRQGIEDPDRRILNAFYKETKMAEKDLYAEGIVQILRTVKAEAFIKVDEVWCLKTESNEARDDFPTDLENHEGAQEAVATLLECKDFRRMVTEPFTRTKRNSGKFVGFAGERTDNTEELVSKDDKNVQVDGRFVGLLGRSRRVPAHLN